MIEHFAQSKRELQVWLNDIAANPSGDAETIYLCEQDEAAGDHRQDGDNGRVTFMIREHEASGYRWVVTVLTYQSDVDDWWVGEVYQESNSYLLPRGRNAYVMWRLLDGSESPWCAPGQENLDNHCHHSVRDMVFRAREWRISLERIALRWMEKQRRAHKYGPSTHPETSGDDLPRR